MKQYLDLCKFVLENGTLSNNRTNIDAISYFGLQTRYDLRKGFPLLTTKKMAYKSIFHELLWFISGNTNIKYLVDNNVRIWNEWPYEKYKKSKSYKNESLNEFIEKIKTDENFAKEFGDLGPVYGKQWRSFNNVDQLTNVINEIKNNPNSRRLIVSAWNPNDINNMLLPPCHCLFQFYINGDQLSCQLYQRSADIFLGVPFNIASYALLVHLIAQVCGLKVGEFIHTLGVGHIYENHIEQIKEQLKREPLPLCKIKINPNIKSIYDFKIDDITIEDYESYPPIKGEVAV